MSLQNEIRLLSCFFVFQKWIVYLVFRRGKCRKGIHRWLRLWQFMQALTADNKKNLLTFQILNCSCSSTVDSAGKREWAKRSNSPYLNRRAICIRMRAFDERQRRGRIKSDGRKSKNWRKVKVLIEAISMVLWILYFPTTKECSPQLNTKNHFSYLRLIFTEKQCISMVWFPGQAFTYHWGHMKYEMTYEMHRSNVQLLSEKMFYYVRFIY